MPISLWSHIQIGSPPTYWNSTKRVPHNSSNCTARLHSWESPFCFHQSLQPCTLTCAVPTAINGTSLSMTTLQIDVHAKALIESINLKPLSIQVPVCVLSTAQRRCVLWILMPGNAASSNVLLQLHFCLSCVGTEKKFPLIAFLKLKTSQDMLNWEGEKAECNLEDEKSTRQRRWPLISSSSHSQNNLTKIIVNSILKTKSLPSRISQTHIGGQFFRV